MIHANWHLPRTEQQPNGLTLVSEPVIVKVLPSPLIAGGPVAE
jgi:hypothetical protein